MTVRNLLSILFVALFSGTVLSQTLIPVDPRATHLRTRNDPAPGFQPRDDFLYVDNDQTARHVDPVVIDLANALTGQPLIAGDHVLLEAVGEYCFHNPTCHLLGSGMWAIFSSDGVLLEDSSRDNVNRVPSSVPVIGETGVVDVVTVPDDTWPTDIPNDFSISAADSSDRTVLRIPDNATHLLVSAPDVQWFDNFVPLNGQYALRITKYTDSSVTGEFTGDGLLTLDDVEALHTEILAETNNVLFDLNYDGFVDPTDLAIWSVDLARTYAGDVNVDGEFNTADLTAVFSAGEYEDGITKNSTWATGDWNGDGEFDSSDLVVALSQGGFEQGPRLSLAAVPEPASLSLLTISVLAMGCMRCRLIP